MILTVGVCLLFASVPAVAQSAADKAAVREATKQYMAAFNNQDVKGMVAFVDENWQNWGALIRVEKVLSRVGRKCLKHRKSFIGENLEEIAVDFVTPDVAFHKFRYGWSGWIDEAGKTVPPSKGLQALLFVRRDGQWLLRKDFWREVEQ